MMMKLLLFFLTAFLAVIAHAATPLPPASLGQVGAPTNGFWLTNVTFVWTNTAVRTPTIDLATVTVYSTNALKGATVLSWDAPTNTVGLTGYRLYYGMTSGGPTNKFLVSSNVNCAVFFNSMSTTSTWWAYATSVAVTSTSTNESAPSASVVFAPK